MSEHPPAQSIRIAIALAALKFKPAGQSYASYLLELCAKFPGPPRATSEEESWQRRALALEKDFAELQTKYKHEHVELLSLRASEQGDVSATQAPPSPSAAPKKKQKKRHVPTPTAVHRLDLDAVLRAVSSDSEVLPKLDLHPLANQFRSLYSLVESPDELSITIIAVAANRIIDSLRALLLTALPPKSTSVTTPSTLDTLSILLPHLLCVVQPLMTLGTNKGKARKAQSRSKIHDANLATAVGDVMGALTESILVPVVRCFATTSSTYLSNLLLRNRQGNARLVDVRPDLFGLLNGVLAALDYWASCDSIAATRVKHLRECLALEVLRQMEKLYVSASASQGNTHTSTSGSGSTSEATVSGTQLNSESQNRKRRLSALMRKDAFWYLANILHLVLISEAGVQPFNDDLGCDEGDSTDRLVQDGFFQALSVFLVRSCPKEASSGDKRIADHERVVDGGRERPDGAFLDEVQRGLVLGIIEKAWMCGVGTS